MLVSVRKKGTDYDTGKRPDSLDQLIRLGGLFQLKDIIERLPFNANTVKNWVYQENSRFRPCFHLIPVGSVRSLKLIDLTRFDEILQETLNPETASAKPKKGRKIP